MFHDNRELRTILSTRPTIIESSTYAAVGAYFNIGSESAALSKKLLGNTEKMWLNAATHKDAKDIARGTSAFVNASYRDIAENAVVVARIWSRFKALSGDRTSDSPVRPVVVAVPESDSPGRESA